MASYFSGTLTPVTPRERGWTFVGALDSAGRVGIQGLERSALGLQRGLRFGQRGHGSFLAGGQRLRLGGDLLQIAAQQVNHCSGLAQRSSQVVRFALEGREFVDHALLAAQRLQLAGRGMR